MLMTAGKLCEGPSSSAPELHQPSSSGPLGDLHSSGPDVPLPRPPDPSLGRPPSATPLPGPDRVRVDRGPVAEGVGPDTRTFTPSEDPRTSRRTTIQGRGRRGGVEDVRVDTGPGRTGVGTRTRSTGGLRDPYPFPPWVRVDRDGKTESREDDGPEGPPSPEEGLVGDGILGQNGLGPPPRSEVHPTSPPPPSPPVSVGGSRVPSTSGSGQPFTESDTQSHRKGHFPLYSDRCTTDSSQLLRSSVGPDRRRRRTGAGVRRSPGPRPTRRRRDLGVSLCRPRLP
ncbi:Hypothetical predicted protein [Marmota monax]|uniref:Uncharacterized protein n=1 Tax=Marmota monax TaxID=9995 RepID=A0A5E4AYT6_MARMO|nr:Hypothetical predicted protein [Marmota monax]